MSHVSQVEAMVEPDDRFLRKARRRIQPTAPDDARPAAKADEPGPERLLTTREVVERTTLTRMSLYRMSREGRFPLPIQLAPTRIAWRERDIDAWVRERVAEASRRFRGER